MVWDATDVVTIIARSHFIFWGHPGGEETLSPRGSGAVRVQNGYQGVTKRYVARMLIHIWLYNSYNSLIIIISG